MSGSLISFQPGEVETLSVDAPYIADPLTLYEQLTEHGKLKNSLLLESAEIDSKNSLKSLILLNSALRISCLGREVTITALTANGKSLLPFLHSGMPGQVERRLTEEKLLLSFPTAPAGLDEEARLKALSPLETLRKLVTELNPRHASESSVFLGGAFAYDLIAAFEPLPEVLDGENTCPDYLFYLAETMIVIDHQEQASQISGFVFGGESGAACFYNMWRRLESLKHHLDSFDSAKISREGYAPKQTGVSVDTSDEEYCHQVEQLQQNIFQGDIFQVVPSRSFQVACPDSLLAYRQLKARNPSPYMFYLNDEGFSLFGASPESALKFNHIDRQVEVYPIAGTRRRGFVPGGGIDRDLDSRIELELRQDTKELSEHLMLVDLARNDIARIAEPGTRHVAELLKVDRYSHVMHLVSRVVGELRQDLDALHAYQACMNMGTLVGAPKIRAAQLIRDVEQKRRGSYGGAVGYLNGEGDMDTCIVIRSAFVKNGIATVQAGAGVVYDSKPQSEADETRSKAQAVLSAIQAANAQLPASPEGEHA
jgi:anthranilate synthase component 1